MKSMTGYGKGAASLGGRTVTVELKSVNNRFLEVNLRLPKNLMALDDIIKKCVSKQLKRGSVEVYFDLSETETGENLSVDESLAKEYIAAAERLSKLDVKNDFTVSTLIRLPDVVKLEKKADAQELLDLTKQAATEAVNNLDRMRVDEGTRIKDDLAKLLANIENALTEVMERAPQIVTEFRKKISDRMREILDGVNVDEARLLNEVAFFADKADINEEMQRLESHIAQFKNILGSEGEAGRKLDFLSQEMNREINTMGSKSNDIEITQRVLYLKNELEKIREQIRNVE